MPNREGGKTPDQLAHRYAQAWIDDALEGLSDFLPPEISPLAAKARTVLHATEILGPGQIDQSIDAREHDHRVFLIPTFSEYLDQQRALYILGPRRNIIHPLSVPRESSATVVSNFEISPQLPHVAIITLEPESEAEIKGASVLERAAFMSSLAVMAGYGLEEGMASDHLRDVASLRSRAGKLAFEIFDLATEGAMSAHLDSLVNETDVSEAATRALMRHPYAMRVIATAYADILADFDPLAGKPPTDRLVDVYLQRSLIIPIPFEPE